MKQIILPVLATLILTLSAFGQASNLLSPIAKTAFEKENFEPCITEMTKIIVREPKNSVAFMERARCYIFGADSTADYERAEKIYLLKLDADKSKALDVIAEKFMDLRNKAMADVEQSIILNPKNAAAFNLRGYMKSLKNKNNEAIADFDKAIEIDPKFIKPYYNRGNSKVEKKDFEGAIADFRKVLEIDPNNQLAIDNLEKLKVAMSSKTKAATTTLPKNSNQCVSGNCVNGKGKMIYGVDEPYVSSVGDVYEGDFVNGKRQGKGILIDKLFGDIYEGGFVNDFQEGQCTLTSKNGDVYTGQFALNGSVTGKLKYANGQIYEGEFGLGVKMGPGGQGTLTTKIGDVYSGKFAFGILGGKVIIKYASGDIYEGGFDNGKRIGQGTYTYKNGNYYNGEWKDNKPHGSGKQYIKATDKFREGIWKDGVYVGKQ